MSLLLKVIIVPNTIVEYLMRKFICCPVTVFIRLSVILSASIVNLHNFITMGNDRLRNESGLKNVGSVSRNSKYLQKTKAVKNGKDRTKKTGFVWRLRKAFRRIKRKVSKIYPSTLYSLVTEKTSK